MTGIGNANYSKVASADSPYRSVQYAYQRGEGVTVEMSGCTLYLAMYNVKVEGTGKHRLSHALLSYKLCLRSTVKQSY